MKKSREDRKRIDKSMNIRVYFVKQWQFFSNWRDNLSCKCVLEFNYLGTPESDT